MTPEDQFDKIADEAIEAADEVKCDFADFVEGLKAIEARFHERRVGAEQELRSKGKAGE